MKGEVNRWSRRFSAQANDSNSCERLGDALCELGDDGTAAR